MKLEAIFNPIHIRIVFAILHEHHTRSRKHEYMAVISRSLNDLTHIYIYIGPLYFFICTNDICMCFIMSILILFADNINILYADKIIKCLVTIVNKELVPLTLLLFVIRYPHLLRFEVCCNIMSPIYF